MCIVVLSVSCCFACVEIVKIVGMHECGVHAGEFCLKRASLTVGSCVFVAGQQQQFHAFAFGQRPFLGGHFASPLDPLQRADSLSFRMPAMSNCQSKSLSLSGSRSAPSEPLLLFPASTCRLLLMCIKWSDTSRCRLIDPVWLPF
jgi:hypothetical protein